MNNKITLKIVGMHCQGCSASVEKALKDVKGVSSVEVNLAAGKAVVDYDDGKTNTKEMAKAVSKAGFSVG